MARGKRDDAAGVLGDDHLANLEDDIRDEGAVLCDRTEHRQEGQQPERRRELCGDFIYVGNRSAAKSERHDAQRLQGVLARSGADIS